jgi:hypothetical protein
MDWIKDLLQRKAQELDSEAKLNDMALIQHELDRYFEGSAHVKRLGDDGTVLITANGSSVASEIRLRQWAIMQAVRDTVKQPVKRFHIRIQ